MISAAENARTCAVWNQNDSNGEICDGVNHDADEGDGNVDGANPDNGENIGDDNVGDGDDSMATMTFVMIRLVVMMMVWHQNSALVSAQCHH